MKIRLALLDNDAIYLNRIVAALSTKYPDNFEIYSFTMADTALATVTTAKIEVLLANTSFELDTASIPAKCGFAYLCEDKDVEMIGEVRAVCKYQKVDRFYRSILSIYSDVCTAVTGTTFEVGGVKTLLFTSASGGTGASSLAAACAVSLAGAGRKVLYLNLEKFGSADNFFSGEGQFDLSDIVFAIKSKKNNLALKLESSVKQAQCGVYFYSASKLALDLQELTGDEIVKIVSELKISGGYEYIVIDTDFDTTLAKLQLMRQANNIVFVTDDSEIALTKTSRAWQSLMLLEQGGDNSIKDYVRLIYNKCTSASPRLPDGMEAAVLGVIPTVENADDDKVVAKLAGVSVFNDII